jgi:hypothetical protein
MKTTILAAVAALMLSPLAAEAQSYRCTSKDGRKYYGSTIPRQCIGQPVELLNAQGTVVSRIDPEGTEKERAAKEAEEAKKRERQLAQREEARRNRALLATYTSAKDIEEARGRALADNQKVVLDIEARIAQVRKRHVGYEKEAELYKDKGNTPAKLAEDLRSAEVELKYQEELLARKRKDADEINARYDEDKKRFVQLTRGR